MTVQELDNYFRSILPIADFANSDVSLNGIQVGDLEGKVGRIAFAVDACMGTFRMAEKWGADMLFVHHGLFWGKPIAVTGPHYERISFLLEHGISLYAAHLPLDMHKELGNNAALAQKLGLKELKEFGEYHGMTIGWQGNLPKPLTMEEALAKVEIPKENALSILPFGPEKIKRVGVISGGAAKELVQALAVGLDLYITGDASHEMYHQALEGRINVIAGGHYNTEVWGVKYLSEKCAGDTGLETEFIDNPTGL